MILIRLTAFLAGFGVLMALIISFIAFTPDAEATRVPDQVKCLIWSAAWGLATIYLHRLRKKRPEHPLFREQVAVALFLAMLGGLVLFLSWSRI